MGNRGKLIAGTIIFCGIIIAAGVLLFPNILGITSATAGQSPQWVQNTGAGISVPACSSASASTFCSGNQGAVTINWSYGGQHGTCAKVQVSTAGQTADGLPCSGSRDFTGLANNTSYNYTVSFYKLFCSIPDEFGCLQWEYAQIDSNSGSYTTPNCTPFDYSLSNSGNITVTRGSSGSNTITATLSAGATQSVSLAASGLPSDATASFSPTSCSPTCTSTLTISTSASTPAGDHTITVTGTPLSKTTTFTLTVYTPTLVITPSSASVQADGGTTQLQAKYDADGPSGPSGEETVTTSSNWSSSDTVKASVNNTTQKGLVTGNTPGSATITATYTDSFGNALSATAAITVTSQPTLSCSPSSQTVIVGETASLSASGGTGNYSWSAPGGSPSSGNQQTFNTSYSSTGTKTVTVSSGSQSANCTVSVESGTLSVSLVADPNSGTAPLNGVDLTATVSGTAPGTINYTFYCNRSDSGTNITSPWDAKFDGITENPKTAVDVCNYPDAGTYTAKVIVERGSAPPAEARQTISVDYPALSVSASVSPSSVTVGQTVQWCASASGGTGSYSYSWSGTDELSGTTSCVSKSYSTSGTKTGSVTVTSGSQTVTQASSNSVTVSGAISSFTASPSTITKGESSTLSWTTAGFDSCSIDQGIGSVATNGTRIVSPTATTTYTLTCDPGSFSQSVTIIVRLIPQFQEILPQ